MKNRTFMQQYRAWRRQGTQRRPHLCDQTVARFGYSLALQLDRYDQLAGCSTRCCIHTRIAYRAAAMAALPDWPARRLDLLRTWRHWA